MVAAPQRYGTDVAPRLPLAASADADPPPGFRNRAPQAGIRTRRSTSGSEVAGA